MSRTVGYRENGRVWMQRRPGECAENVSLLLTRETFVRGEPIEVEGLAPVRALLGLD